MYKGIYIIYNYNPLICMAVCGTHTTYMRMLRQIYIDGTSQAYALVNVHQAQLYICTYVVIWDIYRRLTIPR